MRSLVAVLVGVAGAAVALVLRRNRRAGADALWREATSDTSR